MEKEFLLYLINLLKSFLALFTDMLSVDLEWIVDTAIGILMKNPALFTAGIPHQ